jgi:hypothetical protein
MNKKTREPLSSFFIIEKNYTKFVNLWLPDIPDHKNDP